MAIGPVRYTLLFLLMSTLGAAQSHELPYNSVDCDNANGNPKLCTVESDEGVWLPASMNADGSFPDVERHIARVIGKRYHQRCSNGGGDEPDHDGFRRCVDTFTNNKTGMPCKVNPDQQNQFVCKQKEKP